MIKDDLNSDNVLTGDIASGSMVIWIKLGFPALTEL